jgi:hypothetical protein
MPWRAVLAATSMSIFILWNRVGDVPNIIDEPVLATESCFADDSSLIPAADAPDTERRREPHHGASIAGVIRGVSWLTKRGKRSRPK